MFIKDHGQEIQFYIWDTAGQEEYDALTRKYYKGASACILAYSTDDPKSFLNVLKWKQKVDAEWGDIPMALVQTKIDLKDNQEYTDEETEELAKKCKTKLFLTWSKDNINVKEVFEYLGNIFLWRKSAPSTTEEVKLQGPVATIKDINNITNPQKQSKIFWKILMIILHFYIIFRIKTLKIIKVSDYLCFALIKDFIYIHNFIKVSILFLAKLNEPTKTIKLSNTKVAQKTKKKGIMSWCSIH